MSRRSSAASMAILLAAAQMNAQSISDGLRQRTGFSLPGSVSETTGTFSLPAGVNSTEGLSSRDAVAIALWNNPELQANLASLDVSRADLVEAAQFKNPSFSVLFPVGPKPFELLLAWPLEELWQRKQRIKAAQIHVESVAIGLVQNGLNLIRDTRIAHIDLWLADSHVRILQESSELRSRIATLAQRRLDAGDGTGLDVSLARADAESATGLARVSLIDLEIARTRLRYLLGIRTPEQPVSVSPAQPMTPTLPELASLMELAASNRPDLRAAELRVQAAGEKAKWERSQVLAMLAPTLSIKEVGGAGTRVGPGLNMEIPILSRNEGKISRADAEVVRTGKEYAALRARIEHEVADAYHRIRQAQTSLALLQKQVRPPVEQSIQLSQRAFDNGDLPLLPVLEATRQKHDLDLREAETTAAVQRALAELERAIGKNL